jgi:hypothetical protein
MVRIGDREVPMIERELPDVSPSEASRLIAKFGAVLIQDPRFEAEKKRLEKQGKKALKKLGWIK